MHEGLRIYNLLPWRAGRVVQWQAHLPRIAAMNFNAVYVNGFHAPGAAGSVLDHHALNPVLRGPVLRGPIMSGPILRGAEATDDAALLAGFAASCAEHKLMAMMDLAIDHVARTSPLVARHPAWFARDNTRHGPELAELAFSGDPAEDEATEYFVGVARHYVELGFRAFRCDAAHRVPARVWRAITDAVRARQPGILFCADARGATVPEVLRLARARFDYVLNSAKYWDFTSSWLLDQYEQFRGLAPSIAFPEFHDTPRLAADLARAGITDPDVVRAHYRRAYGFAASVSTAVLMPMGYEYGWARPPDDTTTREPARFDLSPFIGAMNAAKRDTPALNQEGPQRLLSTDEEEATVLVRRTADGADWAYIVLNRDADAGTIVSTDWLLGAAPGPIRLEDVTPDGEGRDTIGLALAVPPLGFRLLRGHAGDRALVAPAPMQRTSLPPEWSPTSRIVIEEVQPELDSGRHPVKCTLGSRLEMSADIFRDGHDVIAAALLYRTADEAAWREAPMRFFDNDRWVGSVLLDENARYRFTIEAWTDVFASWRADAIKKRDAGQGIALELTEGHAMVTAASLRVRGEDAALLRRLLAQHDAGDETARGAVLLSRLLAGIMARWDERGDAIRYRRELDVVVDRPRARFGAWYEMFPRSQGTVPGRGGSFDDAAARLPEIAAMGFDVVYLPPIHPIGRVNRKGRNNSLEAGPDDPGSPYAIGAREGGHDAVHPELGGIAGFRRFVAASRLAGLEVALDFAIQAAPDHPWVREHPEWFTFRPDGTIKHAENPPKKYQDIVNLEIYNRDRAGLWDALREVVLFWIGEGVHIFRVDNPHTKPIPLWEWLIRTVQDRHPDTIFLAEAFTRPKMMRALAKAGFTQSYSYFTWRNLKVELTEYLIELAQGPSRDYLRPNFFTNTPDILPPFLQTGGRAAFRIRLALAALLAPNYGIYSGFELCEATAIPGTEDYLHSEKYEYKVWDWDRPGNIKDEIARINRIRRDNPALHHLVNLTFLRADDDDVLFFGKMTADRSNVILAAILLDPFAARETLIHLPLVELGIAENEPFLSVELLTGTEQNWRGGAQPIRLDPALNPAMIFRIER